MTATYSVVVSFQEAHDGVPLPQPHQESAIGFATFEQAQEAFNAGYTAVAVVMKQSTKS